MCACVGVCRHLSYLGEVSHEVAAFAVVLREHVEEEGFHIVVQRLVVQEELGQ